MDQKWLSKWLGTLVVAVAGILLLNLSSCARNQHLVAINVQPGNGTFAAVDPTAFFNYKAFGTYIHPPATVDITDKVVWQTDNPQVVQITGAGVVSPNTNCGVAQIFATLHDSPNDIVSNSVTITVDGPASSGCPQGGATFNLSVDVSGGTNGVISSSPAGITCGATCSSPFASGSSVALTPTPNAGHTFGGWGVGCTSITGSTCSVTMNSDVTVTATFN